MSHHDSRAIADWFIRRAAKDGRALTNMQLQKLVYFAHGWSLALLGEPLVADEVQAWEFGPVMPELYRSLARWGSGPVREPTHAKAKGGLGGEEDELLEEIYKGYAGRSAYQLSSLTHLKGSPWEQVFEPEQRGKVIPNTLMAEYFSERADAGQ
jgi:uncharacterized phage-associated protein